MKSSQPIVNQKQNKTKGVFIVIGLLAVWDVVVDRLGIALTD